MGHGIGVHPELATIADRNGGPFTAQDAYAAGYTGADVRRMLYRKAWLTLRRGVYVEQQLHDFYAGDPQASHALVVAAAIVGLGAGAVGSHESAARMHGLHLLHEPCSTIVQLTRPGWNSSHGQRANGVQIHAAALPRHHVASLYGVPVTSVARTVVDLACRLPFPEGVALADSTLRRSLTRLRQLHEVLQECHCRPGITGAQRVVAFADTKAESALESIARVMFHEQGLPAPRIQVNIGDEHLWYARVDFFWTGRWTVAEADGLAKYRGGDPHALVAEKLRQERLEELGLEVVRFTWNQVTTEPERTAARIQVAFTRAAARPQPNIRTWW